MYGVVNMDNPLMQDIIAAPSNLQRQFLDTLVLIPEEDTTLQFQAFREAGYTEEQINALRVCLFKRPHGHVRYQDNDLNSGAGRLEPVRDITVWALFFGIPIHSQTNDDGYYNLPWRFSAGTIMGTQAKNSRVNVKPFNTVGGWVIPYMIQAFTVGAVHIRGWVSSCDMRGDVDINFTTHRENRYWAIILNGYAFHDDYADADDIDKVPKLMTCYAQWSDNGNFTGSAPMFGHASFVTLTAEAIVNDVFGGNINIPAQYPNFFNAMNVTGLLPDNSYNVNGVTAGAHFSSRLTHTIFHELGHASHFQQVGSRWWEKLSKAEIISGSDYGEVDDDFWGIIQLAESWAEFIGDNYTRRRYGNFGFKRSSEFDDIIPLTASNVDREKFFVERWIPNGIYNDLMDDANARVLENSRDNVGGSTIHDMYEIFGPDIIDMCQYSQAFLNEYMAFNQADFWTMANRHTINICR